MPRRKTWSTKKVKAGVIKEGKYPKWLSYVVIATKEMSDKLQMCINFRNVNGACPKDSYPLPPIDQLVDLTTKYDLLSFLDALVETTKSGWIPKTRRKLPSSSKLGPTATSECPSALRMQRLRTKG